MTILGWVALTADVNPIVGAGLTCSFKNQLIGIGIAHEPCEPFAKLLLVGEVDVTGFAGHVLRGGGTTYELVELGATVAGADDDGFVDVRPKRFKNLLAEVAKVADDLGVSGILWVEAVVNASGESR